MEAALSSCNEEAAVNTFDLDPHLLSTIFSFCDLRTSACVLRLVCKAWRDACHSPLAFADQRLVLTHPGAAAVWAPCFTLVRCLVLQCNDQLQLDHMIDALATHDLRVQRLKVAIHKTVYQQQIAESLSRLSAAFHKLTHITVKVNMLHTAPDDAHNNNIISDDTELLLSFSQHFPHLSCLHFANLRSFTQQVTPAEQPALLRCVSSLPSLTSVRCSSLSLELHNDTLLHTICHTCPQLREFRVVPARPHGMTLNGLRALCAGCPRLNSIGLGCWWEISASEVGVLLSAGRNIHTLDLRLTQIDRQGLSTVLAEYPQVTRLIVDLAWMYWSPHVRDVILYHPSAPFVSVIHEYLTRVPQVRNVTVRARENEGRFSEVDMLYLRSAHPTVERLVWQRDWLTSSDPCKSEEVFRAETGDPKTYRVFF